MLSSMFVMSSLAKPKYPLLTLNGVSLGPKRPWNSGLPSFSAFSLSFSFSFSALV
jgi:hypothetical protein